MSKLIEMVWASIKLMWFSFFGMLRIFLVIAIVSFLLLCLAGVLLVIFRCAGIYGVPIAVIIAATCLWVYDHYNFKY